MRPFVSTGFALLVVAASVPAQDAVQQPRRVRAFFGVSTVPAPKTNAVKVIYVFPESTAEKAGVRVGDHIITLNDVLIRDSQTLANELRRENVNATIRLVILRDGKRMKLKGKIGSYRKAMAALQERTRNELMGREYPKLPGAVWWDPQTKKWTEESSALENLRGKIGVIFSFDACQYCEKNRYGRLSQMAKVNAQQSPRPPVEIIGVYYVDKPKDDATKEAAELLSKTPPPFPVAVAYYPKGSPTVKERSRNVLLHHHGVAIVDRNGKIVYAQTLGAPGQEFFKAYLAAVNKATPGARPKPAEKDE